MAERRRRRRRSTGEAAVVAGRELPRTRDSLAADLRALGLPAGATVLVHTSLSALGWVAGGPVAVALALLDVLGPAGTLVVPTQSGGLSDPADWSNPPVPEPWWPIIRDATPAYDAALTPTRGMGAVVETVRHLTGFRRSSHPLLSFGAVGPAAAAVLQPHPLAPALGDGSPLSRLAEAGALTLLLGAGWHSATALHLGEARAGLQPVVGCGAPVLVDGVRRWLTWQDMDWDETPFPALGSDLEATGAVRVGPVGSATARLVGVAEVAGFAERWLRERPPRGAPRVAG